MKITDFANAEEGSNFDRMWKRPSRPRCFCDGYVVIGEAIRPRDILLAGDAHIAKFRIAMGITALFFANGSHVAHGYRNGYKKSITMAQSGVQKSTRKDPKVDGTTASQPKVAVLPTRHKPTTKLDAPTHWKSESLSVITVFVAVFLFLSLVSLIFPGALQFSFGKILGKDQISAGNLMGPIGDGLGQALLDVLGWCSLSLVPFLLVLAKSFWRGLPYADGDNRLSRRMFSRGFWLFLSLAALTSAFAVGFGYPGGGALGSVLGFALVTQLNEAGAILVSLAIFVFAIRSLTPGLLSGSAAFLYRTILLLVSMCRDTGFLFGALFLSLLRSIFGAFSLLFQSTKKGFELIFSGAWHLLGILLGIGSSVFTWLKRRHVAPTIISLDVVESLPPSAKSKNPKIRPLIKEELTPPILEPEKPVIQPVLNYRSNADAAKKRGVDSKPQDDAHKHRLSGSYILPSSELLVSALTDVSTVPSQAELLENCKVLERTLGEFRIGGNVVEVQPGPVITLYQFQPAAGVKVQRVISLADDLALSLKVESVRVFAPVAGKGTVGIEVPNRLRETVRIRDVIEAPEFSHSKSQLVLALGKDTQGEPFVTDLANMPHLLIAGATGSGKSVCINSLLISLLYRNSPETLRFILIDPKMLELSVYEGIPHLKSPVITDPKKAKGVLWWAVQEMERRYELMKGTGVRGLIGYNRMVTAGSSNAEPLPNIVVVVDELADLMLTVGKEIEELLTRLAQKARAAGIHLIVATQRPSVNVITGLIKANFPSRLSFQVASRIDSRTVLDGSGAEKLLGRGDMLFMTPGAGRVRRLHGAFLSDEEVVSVVASIKAQGVPDYDPEIDDIITRMEEQESSPTVNLFDEDSYDPLYDKAVQYVVEKGQASTSMVQRAFRIGYNRAARILEIMENEGIVGPADGAKPRQILVMK